MTYNGAAAEWAWGFQFRLRRQQIAKTKWISILLYYGNEEMELTIHLNHLFSRSVSDVNVAGIGLGRRWPRYLDSAEGGRGGHFRV